MVSKHLKRCSTLSVVSELQIRTTIQYPFTPTRMAIIKKGKITTAGEDVDKLEHSYIASGNVKLYSCCGEQFSGSSSLVALH